VVARLVLVVSRPGTRGRMTSGGSRRGDSGHGARGREGRGNFGGGYGAIRGEDSGDKGKSGDDIEGVCVPCGLVGMEAQEEEASGVVGDPRFAGGKPGCFEPPHIVAAARVIDEGWEDRGREGGRGGGRHFVLITSVDVYSRVKLLACEVQELP
jgi:hypothetical protein